MRSKQDAFSVAYEGDCCPADDRSASAARVIFNLPLRRKELKEGRGTRDGTESLQHLQWPWFNLVPGRGSQPCLVVGPLGVLWVPSQVLFALLLCCFGLPPNQLVLCVPAARSLDVAKTT